MLSFLIATIATFTAAGVGYMQSRGFVSKRLRYVDQAHNPAVPIVAGVAAGALAIPVVAILPWIGAGTAIAFGLAVGFGTRAGVKSFDRALMP